MTVKGFPGYTYNNGILYNRYNKIVKMMCRKDGYKTYKVKNNTGKWVQLNLSKLKSLVGEVLKMPDDAKKIPGYNDYYIDKRGTVYSFSIQRPDGIIMKQSIGSNGYPKINLGARKSKEIHQLLAITFIVEDYIERGLCVLHRDDNKLNCVLTNLCVGTYSQNNKDAYKSKLNPGNGLKKKQGVVIC